MRLRPLVSTAFLTAEYDAQDACLFIHLQSFADLPTALPSKLPALHALLAAGQPLRCLVQTSFSAAPPAPHVHWLTNWLLPQLFRVGVTQWLWVCPPTAHNYRLLELVRYQLPYLALSTFYDVEQAVTWLCKAPAAAGAYLPTCSAPAHQEAFL